MAQPKFKSELESLREDAQQIISDISHLSDHVSEATKDEVKGLKHSINERTRSEIEDLRQRLKEVEQQSREYAAKMDQHIKSHPYLYILGTAGFAYLLGRLVFHQKN